MKNKIASMVFSGLGVLTLIVGCIQIPLTYSIRAKHPIPGDTVSAEIIFVFLYAYVFVALIFFIVSFVLLCISISKDKKNAMLDEKKKSEISQNH